MPDLPNSVFEPARERPVLRDVDVAVAGSGLSATFAAIAAARVGARTLLIERFGSLGGNMGPAMICGGGLAREAEVTLPGGLAGIAREFIERVADLCIGSDSRYREQSSAASFVAAEMCREAEVELLLSAWASDPIMDGDTVRGLFVETSAGRMAVRARVTVDGTGDAGVAARAGARIIEYLEQDESLAPYIRPRYLDPAHPTYYNDTMLPGVMAGVDLARYQEYVAQPADLSDEDRAWAEAEGIVPCYPEVMVPALRQAWEGGGFLPWVEIAPGVMTSAARSFADYGGGNVGFYVSCLGAINCTDPDLVTAVEDTLRSQAFRLMRFYRAHVPGFENAYLTCLAPWIGMRGGPHIEGDHTLTPEEAFGGLRRDDVLFRNIHEGEHGGEPSGFDVPLAIALPRGIEGLLVCGRGAAYLRRGHDPSGMRARPAMMVFGQTVGTAASIAALDGVAPRAVDIRKVQRRLIADGIVLGEPERLRELGLA